MKTHRLVTLSSWRTQALYNSVKKYILGFQLTSKIGTLVIRMEMCLLSLLFIIFVLTTKVGDSHYYNPGAAEYLKNYSIVNFPFLHRF